MIPMSGESFFLFLILAGIPIFAAVALGQWERKRLRQQRLAAEFRRIERVDIVWPNVTPKDPATMTRPPLWTPVDVDYYELPAFIRSRMRHIGGQRGMWRTRAMEQSNPARMILRPEVWP